MWATSTPSSASRSETQGPLRSAIRPVSTSVPVTTIPAAHRRLRLTAQVGLSRFGRACVSVAAGVDRVADRAGARRDFGCPCRRCCIVTSPLPKETVKLPERNGPSSSPARRIWPSTSGLPVGVEQADPDFGRRRRGCSVDPRRGLAACWRRCGRAAPLPSPPAPARTALRRRRRRRRDRRSRSRPPRRPGPRRRRATPRCRRRRPRPPGGAGAAPGSTRGGARLAAGCSALAR